MTKYVLTLIFIFRWILSSGYFQDADKFQICPCNSFLPQINKSIDSLLNVKSYNFKEWDYYEPEKDGYVFIESADVNISCNYLEDKTLISLLMEFKKLILRTNKPTKTIDSLISEISSSPCNKYSLRFQIKFPGKMNHYNFLLELKDKTEKVTIILSESWE